MEGKGCILVCVLPDNQGKHTYVAGIHLKLSLTYDCMEEYEFVLNTEHLSHFCGDDWIFREFRFVAELR